jgi:hypothetical protein
MLYITGSVSHPTLVVHEALDRVLKLDLPQLFRTHKLNSFRSKDTASPYEEKAPVSLTPGLQVRRSTHAVFGLPVV